MKRSSMNEFFSRLLAFGHSLCPVICAAVLTLGTLFLGASDAWATDSDFSTGVWDMGESPRRFELEFNGTFFQPQIHREKGVSGSPYETIFGKRSLWLFEGEFDYELFDLLGPLGIGGGIGFGRVTGKSIYEDSGEKSPDKASLSILPLRLMVVYRFQWFDRQGVPLIPFVKAGLGYTFWWTKNGDNQVPKIGERKGRGGKWGYNLAIGIALSLNFIDRPLARDADRLWGINDCHLLVQFVHATADNFGGVGLNLSRDSLYLGLGLEF